MSVVISIVIGCLIDMVIGTPVFILKIRRTLIALFRKFFSGKKELYVFLIMMFSALLLSFGVNALINLIKYYNMIWGILFESIICYICISSRVIKDNAEKIYKPLKKEYYKRAAKMFNSLNRGKAVTDPQEIAEGTIVITVDSIADKVIAPLFFIIIFGGAGGVFYKIIVLFNISLNRNVTRIIRNILALIPVRIASLFMLLSSKMLGLNTKGAIKTFAKYRYKFSNINRGLPLSICAGALGISISLRRVNPIIPSDKKADCNDIKSAYEMIHIASLVALVALVVIRMIIVVFSV